MKPKAFLLQVARNLFINGYRRDRLRAAHEQPLFATQARAAALAQVEAFALKDIILSMPEKLRDVFMLSRFGAHEPAADRGPPGHFAQGGRMADDQALACGAAQLRE